MTLIAEKLNDILLKHTSSKLLPEARTALLKEILETWLYPIAQMSCTAMKPCGAPECLVCKPKNNRGSATSETDGK